MTARPCRPVTVASRCTSTSYAARIRSSRASGPLTPERRGPGQDQVDLDVREHPRSPPVVAGHESGLRAVAPQGAGSGGTVKTTRPARSPLSAGHTGRPCRRRSSRPPSRRRTPRRARESRPSPRRGRGRRPAWCRDASAAAGGDGGRRRVDGDDLVADGRAPVGQHPVGGAAERRHARLAAGDVVEERAVAVDRPRLDDRDVARPVPQQLGGQRDPGVAAADHEHVVVDEVLRLVGHACPSSRRGPAHRP